MEVGCDPAKHVTPLTLKVDDTKWLTNTNKLSPRLISSQKSDALKEMIKILLKNNIIRVSQAEAYSQVLLVPKTNGTWRLCIDYRQLNQVTNSMGWRIPNIKQMSHRLKNIKPSKLAVLDLASGYHQRRYTKIARNTPHP